jgi:hypothetical protein
MVIRVIRASRHRVVGCNKRCLRQRYAGENDSQARDGAVNAALNTLHWHVAKCLRPNMQYVTSNVTADASGEVRRGRRQDSTPVELPSPSGACRWHSAPVHTRPHCNNDQIKIGPAGAGPKSLTSCSA